MKNLARSSVLCVPFCLRKHVRSIPGIAQVQRWLAARVLDGTAFEHQVDAGPAKGVRFWVHMPEDKGIWTGTYELRFAECIASAIRPGCVAYDIGGWHGFFAGVMAAQGARQVVVFEPLPVNAERIEQLIALNPLLPIQLYRLALAANKGTAELVVMPDTSMAKLGEGGFQSGDPGVGHIVVRTATIDDLVTSKAIPEPDVLKLDVEGAEMLVLTGAKTVLARSRPIVFAELHSSELLHQVSSLLQMYGYAVTPISENETTTRTQEVFQIHAVPS